MTQLEALHRDRDISLYQIEDNHSPIEEYIFSTPETREICNRPELVGIKFPEGMRTAASRLLKLDPLAELIGEKNGKENCILHFLRGGLNFQLREALSEAYGFNRQYCSYMTSQRYQRGKRWQIKQDQYRKIDYLPGSTLLIGDCIATGSTMENGLQVLLENARTEGKPVSNLVVLTIGCGRARDILTDFHRQLEATFDYDRTLVFYVEGRFKLAEEDMDLTIALPGTDLLRRDALLAPEYELSLYERLHIPLERCTIYDLGAKSFTYQEHVAEVVEYWQQLKDSSLTLQEAYRERWPEDDYQSLEALKESRREIWPFLSEAELEELYEAYRQRWEEKLTDEKDVNHQALERLANKRIQVMEELL